MILVAKPSSRSAACGVLLLVLMTISYEIVVSVSFRWAKTLTEAKNKASTCSVFSFINYSVFTIQKTYQVRKISCLKKNRLIVLLSRFYYAFLNGLSPVALLHFFIIFCCSCICSILSCHLDFVLAFSCFAQFSPVFYHGQWCKSQDKLKSQCNKVGNSIIPGKTWRKPVEEQ